MKSTTGTVKPDLECPVDLGTPQERRTCYTNMRDQRRAWEVDRSLLAARLAGMLDQEETRCQQTAIKGDSQ